MQRPKPLFPDFLHRSRLEASSFRLLPVCTGLCQPAFTPSAMKLPAKALPALFHADPRRFCSPRPSARYFHSCLRMSVRNRARRMFIRMVQLKPLPESPLGASTKCLCQFEHTASRSLFRRLNRKQLQRQLTPLRDSPFGSSLPSACH
jgi:hypothetical protein